MNDLLIDGGCKSVKERPREREMSKQEWYYAPITVQIPLQMEGPTSSGDQIVLE